MNRALGVVWCLRKDFLPPYVETTNDDQILIYGGVDEDGLEQFVKVSRKDARLLAKRINQCLDATVKR